MEMRGDRPIQEVSSVVTLASKTGDRFANLTLSDRGAWIDLWID